MVAASAASTIGVGGSRLRLLLAAMNSFIYMLRRAAYSWDGLPELASPQLGAMQCRIKVDICGRGPWYSTIKPRSEVALRLAVLWLYCSRTHCSSPNCINQ